MHTQAAAGILPIQPAALTPRKRANLPGVAAQPVGEYGRRSPLRAGAKQNQARELRRGARKEGIPLILGARVELRKSLKETDPVCRLRLVQIKAS